MARKKSTETIDAEIAKVMADVSKLQDRYDNLQRSSRIFRSRSAAEKRMSLWKHT